MKRFLLFILAVSFSFYMFGCAKKEATEESLEAISMEALTSIGTTQPVPGVKPVESKAAVVPAVTSAVAPATTPVQEAKLEPLPPAGPYKPAPTEIQTALKNAGFYTGIVDGKIGPMSKKAVVEFQKANGLDADGKVGPKTWAALAKYLNPPAAETTAPAKKR